MSKFEWTKEQKEVIESRDKNILVSAGAGSGKTAVLTERLKRLILEDGRDCSEMLVLTFTRAAAAEMKQRFIDQLILALNEKEYQRGKQSILSQIDAVTDAQISTIDSFAASMSRRYFEIAGVDPGFRVADQTELNLIREETLEEVFEEKFNDFEEGKDTSGFIELIDLFGGSRSNEGLKDRIRELLIFFESIPDPKAWVKEVTSQIECCGVENFFDLPVFESLKENIKSDISEIVKDYKFLNLIKKDIPWQPKRKGPQLLENEISAVFELETANSLEDISSALSLYPKSSRILLPKATSAEISEQFKKHRDRAKKKINGLKKYGQIDFESEYTRTLEMNEHFKNLCKLTFEIEEKISEKKQSARLMSFNDLERALIRILNDKKTREEIQKRYAYIFLDEFQDSTIRFQLKRLDMLKISI